MLRRQQLGVLLHHQPSQKLSNPNLSVRTIAFLRRFISYQSSCDVIKLHMWAHPEQVQDTLLVPRKGGDIWWQKCVTKHPSYFTLCFGRISQSPGKPMNRVLILESSATSVSNLLRLARGRSEDRNWIAKNRFLGPIRTSKRSLLYQRKASLFPVYQELVT